MLEYHSLYCKTSIRETHESTHAAYFVIFPANRGSKPAQIHSQVTPNLYNIIKPINKHVSSTTMRSIENR
jgi:hypothetical protein